MAALIGYSFGLFAAALAFAAIFQYGLGWLPFLKRDLRFSYAAATLLGLLLIGASAESTQTSIFAGALLLGAMYWLYLRRINRSVK